MTGGSWEREGVDDGEGFGNGVGADDEVGGADKDGEDDFGGGDRSDKDGEGKEDGRDGEGYVGAEGAEDGELPSMGGEEEGDQDDANVLCGRRRRPRARRLAAFNGSRRWTLFRDFRAVRVLHFNRQRRAHLLRPAGIGSRSSNFPRSPAKALPHTSVLADVMDLMEDCVSSGASSNGVVPTAPRPSLVPRHTNDWGVADYN